MGVLPRRLHDQERGFTLVELLVVVMIIGVLAAIALPAFLGQQKKGQDADAKSNARNLVSHVESCFANEHDYGECDNTDALGDTGIGWGTDPEQASVTLADDNSFTVEAVSKANTDGNHKFRITKNTDGTQTRECDPDGEGACKADGTW